MGQAPPIDAATFVWRLGATLLFVVINGFFVAAEFALVKARVARVRTLAEQGSGRARMVMRLLARLDLYLSSCQLGITVASLILGWLAEPAIARLLLVLAAKIGFPVEYGPMLHAVALAVALTIVTILHMTLGEQAPKILAIHRAEAIALKIAYPLYGFTTVLRPLIWFINRISNALLRLVGVQSNAEHEGPMSADELKDVVAASARAGHISPRQRTFTENILSLMTFEVRHILVPRVDIVELSLGNSAEDNIRIIRESNHSRFPLCDGDLDNVIGIIHAKDVFRRQASEEAPDLRKLARKTVVVPDTQPLGRMLVELQRAQRHCAIVLDDHGTAIGMAFLEDAIEEIVGPIYDEFDEGVAEIKKLGEGVFEMPGSVPMPEAVTLLGLDPEIEEDDTIGGHVVSELGRLPEKGDALTIGQYSATVLEVGRNRITKLRLEPVAESDEGEPS